MRILVVICVVRRREVQERMVAVFERVDKDYGRRVAAELMPSITRAKCEAGSGEYDEA